MSLLINGARVPVPGLNVIGPGDTPWCRLDAKDCRPRKSRWVRQVMLHCTIGDGMTIIPGAGPLGKPQQVADYWRGDPTPSAAHIVVGFAGEVACLADLALICAYHATVSNDISVGIEQAQRSDGGVYEATLDATVKLVAAICDAMSIPFQYVADPYKGHPLPRMLNGGQDVVGVTAHRLNTESRGWGDPGDEIFVRLKAAGCEPVLLADNQDLHLGAARQSHLNANGGHLDVDGLVGPASIAEAKRQGFTRWRDVPTG